MPIGKIELRIKVPEYENKHFYGKVNATHTITEEIEFEKFEVRCPEQNVSVSFKDPHGNTCYLNVNPYGWSDHDNGLFEALICDDTYLYELDIHCDENDNVIVDDTTCVNLYDVNDKETLIDVLEVTEFHTTPFT